jgi:hypothetical protein
MVGQLIDNVLPERLRLVLAGSGESRKVEG